MTYLVREIHADNPQDMERVAAMFNDFDNTWPGGFTRGIPETAERIRDRMQRNSRLAICVVQHEDEFVGYCDLKAQKGQTDRAYIPLLGARLSHQGNGVGKMLLREMVRRVTEAGFREVTLGTWGGNTKAVPLYKKIGFHWVPETNVWMRNFIPTALTLPAGRKFFAERDWYACHERNIVVEADDVTWKGMKVYPYWFRDGDDFLNLVFEASSGRLTGLETPEYAVSCSIPTEEGAAGETYPIVWEISARAGRPLEVTLLTEADAGLDARVQERFTVTETTTLTRELYIASDARPRGEGEPAYSVRSTLLINGEPITLETGVKVVRPVEVEVQAPVLMPGRQEKIVVLLNSRLDRPLQGTLTLDAHPELHCAQAVQPFEILPRSRTEVAYEISTQATGALQSALRLVAGAARVTRPLVFASVTGSTVATVDRQYAEVAELRSQNLSAKVRLRGGGIQLSVPALSSPLLEVRDVQIGPPFAGWQLRPPVLEARIETRHGQPTLITTLVPEEMPGVRVERALTLLGDTLARLDVHVIHTGEQPYPAQIRIQSESGASHHLTVPTPEGLIREPLLGWGEYPAGMGDVLADGASPTENWIATEQDGLMAGLVWHGSPTVEFEWNRFPALIFDLGELPPHTVTSLEPVYFVLGGGDWSLARDAWQRLVQPSGTIEQEKPEPRRVLEVNSVPLVPALVGQGKETVTLEVTNLRGKALTGTLTLEGGEITVEPNAFPLENVDRARPATLTTSLSVGAEPAAAPLTAILDSGSTGKTFLVPILNTGSGETVRITPSKDGVTVIDNGWMTLRFASGFLGSLIAVERNGVNHLFSAYPKSGPFVWTNPWFGGVHPFLDGWMGDEKLTTEAFTGEPVERVGAQGFRWQGVLAQCEPQHKDRRWLKIETEYLTLPGSNLVALVTRYTNKSSARVEVHGGVAAWTQPGGSRANTVGHWDVRGERQTHRRGGFGIEASATGWAAAQNPETNDVLLMAATHPKSHLHTEDMQAEGVHFGTVSHLSLLPNETKETVDWLALFQGKEAIETYTSLKNLRVLP